MKKTLFALVLVLACLAGCGPVPAENTAPEDTSATQTAYDQAENWAYLDTGAHKSADVFFLCPTVYAGAEDAYNLSLDDQETKENFVGAINMEKGIYPAACRFFAPYYRQVGLNVYELPKEEQDPYFSLAYQDVKDAFLYYLDHYNQGQPILLAGFSQGADMCLRLMKDCFTTQELQDQLVACYAIGWRLTQEEVDQFPQLRPATGETDTGVVVSFNSEAPSVEESLLLPAGTKSLSINPLNWRTDSTPADKSENAGACFTDYSGAILSEVPQLTGAYLDPVRGALKVPDVSPTDYPPGLSIFSEGVYHLYDYQFFYRNLQENASLRLEHYLAAQQDAAA